MTSACQNSETAALGLCGEGSRLGTSPSLRQQDQAEPQEAQAVARKRDANGRFVKNIKLIDGEPHKLCHGPGHDEPTWLPATDKFFYRHKTGDRAGNLTSRCRLCANWTKLKSPGLSGRVPRHIARPFFIEGVNRVGLTEFARRTGINETTISYIVHDKTHAGKLQRTVQKRIVRAAMLEVISMRRKNEVRHRASIKVGASIRGLPEREVINHDDLYQPESVEQRKERLAVEAERGRQRRKEAKQVAV